MLPNLKSQVYFPNAQVIESIEAFIYEGSLVSIDRNFQSLKKALSDTSIIEFHVLDHLRQFMMSDDDSDALHELYSTLTDLYFASNKIDISLVNKLVEAVLKAASVTDHSDSQKIKSEVPKCIHYLGLSSYSQRRGNSKFEPEGYDSIKYLVIGGNYVAERSNIERFKREILKSAIPTSLLQLKQSIFG